MSVTMTAKVELKLQPVLKTIVYAALAGEFLRNTGITDDQQLGAVQQAVAEGLVERVIVIARRPDGGVDEHILRMTPPAPGEILNLALEPGKSVLESVDVKLAGAVKYTADLLKRRGLKPEYKVGWSSKVRVNPALGAEAIKRLNFRAEPLPEVPPPPKPIEWTPAMLEAINRARPAPPPAPVRYPHTVNTYTGPAAIPPTQTYTSVVKITPAADPNISYEWRTSVPKT